MGALPHLCGAQRSDADQPTHLPWPAACLVPAGLLLNAGESMMDLVDKWPYLRLSGIREQDDGIGPQLCLSLDLCV